MAADGIEEGTPKDKAGARALVFWLLVMSVPSQGPSSPLLKSSRHSRQDTTSGNAPGPDKGALEAMPCIQGLLGSSCRSWDMLQLELLLSSSPHSLPPARQSGGLLPACRALILACRPGSRHPGPAQQSQCRLLADECPVESIPSSQCPGSCPAQAVPFPS